MILRLAIALALVYSLAGCDVADKAPVSQPLRPVKISTVSENGNVRSRTFSGVSQSTQESRMSFKVGGTIVELPVQVGDQLAAGDLIARLNRSSYDLQVQQSQASLSQAQAAQRNADANYQRMKGLYENSNVSRNDLDVARANAESAQAEVRAARKSLEIAQLNRSYTRLTAVGDCTVASVDVEINENVSAGGTVANVSCGTGIEVRLGIPESLIGEFSQGMPADVKFDALPGQQYTGEVTEVGVGSSGSASTFPVVVALKDRDRAVRSSMAAEVSFEFENLQADTHVIPASAVINDETGTFVFIAVPSKDNEAIIERRSIQIGELTQNGIEVLEGLALGDRVVTAGTSVIRAQQTVLLP